MEVSACCPIPVLSISPEPGTSPEDPLPAGGGEDEDEEGAAELPEAMAPEVPQEPRSPQQSAAQPSGWVLRERREPASLKETPDPWQSLDPFDSLDSKPFKKGRPYSVPPCGGGSRTETQEEGCHQAAGLSPVVPGCLR